MDTVFQPEGSLKDKMSGFKEIRTGFQDPDAFGIPVQGGATATAQATEGAAGQPTPAEARPAKTGATGEKESEYNPFAVQGSILSGDGTPDMPTGGGDGEVEKTSSGKTKVQAQHALQMAMNNRQRVLDLLSNIMKAIHDTQMTAIRNLR